MLSIVTPAADPNLLTASEMRLAVGLQDFDFSKDAQLSVLNGRVSRAIASHCRISMSGTAIPTLREETLSQTVRMGRGYSNILLSRRPIVSIASVVEDGVTLDASSYEIDHSAGILRRLEDDRLSSWACGKIVVVYVAGWAVVPDDIRAAASKLASEMYVAGTRDPNLKRIKVDGVDEREYWVSPSSDQLISKEVEALLSTHTNIWLG